MDAIAIVGGSLAGLRSAEALRRRGYDGRIVFVGEKPERPYDRPPLSKEVLAGVREPQQIALANALPRAMSHAGTTRCSTRACA